MTTTAWFTKTAAAVCLPGVCVSLLVAPDAAGATRVPLRGVDRRCDFTPNAPVPTPGYGTAEAMISRAGSTVTAEVRLNYAVADTHYDVILIQVPRPSASTCNPGDPGTAVGSLNTDGGGSGSVTVADRLGPGISGVWVTVRRPAEHSQSPAEFYNSDFIAPV